MPRSATESGVVQREVAIDTSGLRLASGWRLAASIVQGFTPVLVTYHYISPIGTFWVKPLLTRPSRFLLGVDETSLGAYDSPHAAAEAVFTRATGWRSWDSLPSIPAPASISDWEVGPPA
jgi:hypothetical protein